MKLGFNREQNGFTLVELMVVMAIMAVLASVVVPAVAGTKQVSQNTRVQQSASVISAAVSRFNIAANQAELLTTANLTVLGESATAVISNKWPEKPIRTPAQAPVQRGYLSEFPAAVGSTANTVRAVTIRDEDGKVLYGTGRAPGKQLADFFAAYNLVTVGTLKQQGYLTKESKGFAAMYSQARAYHNYLWLLKKVRVGDDPDGGRVVQVFSLIAIVTDANGADALTYRRIF